MSGGGERIRTAGLPRARRTLCQLSYTPVYRSYKIAYSPPINREKIFYGGPKSTRTTDLPVISGVLCQLSYRPLNQKNLAA